MWIDTLMSPPYLPYEIAILFFMALSAFFSGTETALVSAGRLRLKIASQGGDAGAQRALGIIGNTEQTLSVILVGNNLANIAATSFLTFVASRAFLLNDKEMFLVTTIQAVVFLLFCEVLPKLLARAYADWYLSFFSIPVRLFTLIFSPLVYLVNHTTSLMKRFAGVDPETTTGIKSRDEVELLFRMGHEHGAIVQEDRLFVSEILSFKDLTAREIMTPVVEIVSIDEDDSLKKVINTFSTSGFSRLPVYRDRVDNIIGYVFYRNFFTRHASAHLIKEQLIPARYVPATKNVYDLHHFMMEEKLPVVFVVDEYGGVIGMVTGEDIAEEIVGEIQTRDHDMEQMVEKINARRYILDGSLSIEYLRRVFHLSIEKKGYETIAGFMACRAGAIPQPGYQVKLKNVIFTVEESDQRQVSRVSMTLK